MGKNILLFFFIIFYFFSEVYSQEFDVREFKADPSDLAAIRFPRLSVNDEPCALIKVVTNVKGMQFDSNQGIVDMVHQEEGYWLYVPPLERRIRLMAEGFLPLDLALPEPAVGNKVYNLVVTSKGVVGNLDVIPVNFIVEGHPDAVLIIGDDTFPVGQTVRLPRGLIGIRIEKPGYRPVVTQIDINETNTLFRYQLEGINEEVVTIRSNPPGAAIYINNVRRTGNTPFQEFLFPGSYNLRLSLSEYNDLDTRILVQEKQNNEFTFDLQKFVGTLVLKIDPSDARVTINQRNYTGQKEIQFAPGTYRIIIEKPGYNSQEDRILIEEGKRTERTFSLIAKTGSLRFVSQNPDARYKLKNQKAETVSQWSGTRLMPGLPIGDYTFEGELEGYANLKGSLSITENQETRVDAAFTQAQRTAYIQEQERIASENKRKQDLQQAQINNQRREAEERDRLKKQERRAKSKAYFSQETYSTLNISYNQLNLNTNNFVNNIESNAGLGFGMTGFFDYWAMNLSGSYTFLNLNERAISRFGVENVEVLGYSFSFGPAFRMFGFEFFAMGGFEGVMVFSEAFEYEDVTAGDAIIEYGVLFKPRDWGIGLRFSSTYVLDFFDGYPPFSRQEFGLVFSF
jgi:hypothetical protein